MFLITNANFSTIYIDDGFLQFESFFYPGCYITANAKTKELLPFANSKDGSNCNSHFILRPMDLVRSLLVAAEATAVIIAISLG